MKKVTGLIIAAILMALMIVALNSPVCRADEEPLFGTVWDGRANYFVVYCKETKVMYAVSDGMYSRGVFTLLVNPDGTPMLWKGDEN